MGGLEQLRHGREPLPPDTFGIILIGASGTGKSSSAAMLRDQGIVEVTPTVATRDLRPMEIDNPPCDHIFVSDTEFDELEADKQFIDTKPIYKGRYGVPWFPEPPAGRLPLVVLKPDFVKPVLEQYPFLRTYQLEASEATVRQRMQSRGQERADIADRIRKHALETAMGRRLADHKFRNEGKQEDTVKQIAIQIQADYASYLAAQALAEAEPTPASVTMELPYDAEPIA